MWIEDPFRSVIGATLIIFVAVAALGAGMATISLFV